MISLHGGSSCVVIKGLGLRALCCAHPIFIAVHITAAGLHSCLTHMLFKAHASLHSLAVLLRIHTGQWKHILVVKLCLVPTLAYIRLCTIFKKDL